jgi:hypothetical protein
MGGTVRTAPRFLVGSLVVAEHLAAGPSVENAGIGVGWPPAVQ